MCSLRSLMGVVAVCLDILPSLGAMRFAPPAPEAAHRPYILDSSSMADSSYSNSFLFLPYLDFSGKL